MADLPIVSFANADELWAWLRTQPPDASGVWVRLQKSASRVPSVTFPELLEAGIAFGWSESTRRSGDATSYLQKFTPRRSRGTASERNLAIARRLDADGRLTEAGRRALGWSSASPRRADTGR